MKALSTAIAATALLTGVAFAQTTTTTTMTTGSTTTVIDQATLPKVKQYIVSNKTSASVPSGFSLSVGAEIPQSVTLHDFGSDVGVRNYKYVVINDRAAIVDPQSRKVVQIIETR
jgi:hypothetical protein